MRRKMLLLALGLAATAASLTGGQAQAGPLGGGGPYHACPQCTTYPDGFQCCIPCQCNDGGVMLCPDIGCAEI